MTSIHLIRHGQTAPLSRAGETAMNETSHLKTLKEDKVQVDF